MSPKGLFVFFSIATELGGAEKSLLDLLIEYKKRNKHQTLVVVPKSTGPLLDRLTDLGIPYHVLSMPTILLRLSRQKPFQALVLAIPCGILWWFHLWKIHYFLRKHPVQTLHSTGIKYHLTLGVLSFYNRYRLLLHWRDILIHPGLKKTMLFLSRNPRIHWVANSQATAASLAPIPSQVVYNGFDQSHWLPTKNDYLSKKFVLKNQSINVGIIGVLARWKGQREFIQMAKNVADKFPQLNFFIVGSEIYDTVAEVGEKNQLLNDIQASQLQKRIFLLDYQTQIEKIYQSLDIFVHASTRPEPFGRVVIEAMLSGCTVMAANAGGPKEIIQHSQDGWLYKMGDVASMTQALEHLVSEPELRHRLSQAAPASGSRFSMDNYVDQMEHALSKQQDT